MNINPTTKQYRNNNPTTAYDPYRINTRAGQEVITFKVNKWTGYSPVYDRR
jgi:hypothetical protein